MRTSRSVLTLAAAMLAFAAACGAEPTEPTGPGPSPTSPGPTEGDDNFMLGPDGFGGLTLGITKSVAADSGLAVEVDPATPPACGGPGDGFLVGYPADGGSAGQLVFSDNGLFAIYAYEGIETPEGIALGSTRAQVDAAYPGFEMDAGLQDGWGIAPVAGNPDAHYRIELTGGRVSQLILEANGLDCDN
jgi:hypothetical protein